MSEEGVGEVGGETEVESPEAPALPPPVRMVKISDLEAKPVNDVKANGYIPVAVAGMDTFRVALSELVNMLPPGGGGEPGGGGGGEVPGGSQKLFGVMWSKFNTTTQLTRTRNATDFSFAPAVGGEGGHSDFDDQPVFNGIRLCYVVNGQVVAYQGDPNGLFPADHAPANGDIMVEIKKFHYRIDDLANTMEIIVSDQPFDGSSVSPRHAPHAGKPEGYEYIYVAAYTCNEDYRSKSGVASKVTITRAAARTGCRGRGVGVNAGKYQQYDFLTYRTICLLYLVETANWDSQAAVGAGYTASGNSGQVNTGGTKNITFHSGSMVSAGLGTAAVKYRHMENLWGNIRQWVDGINFNERVARIAANPANYADDTDVGYSTVSFTNAAANGYIKAMGVDGNFPYAMLPTDTSGAVGTYIPDCYYSGVGWRVLAVGGIWSDDSYAGLFCFYANYDASGTYAYIGARLLFLP